MTERERDPEDLRLADLVGLFLRQPVPEPLADDARLPGLSWSLPQNVDLARTRISPQVHLTIEVMELELAEPRPMTSRNGSAGLSPR